MDMYVTHLHNSWHLVVCSSPTYVKLSQRKEVNYKIVESKLKISQNLCKLVEM
jgi:hypothetical protein